MPPISRKRPPSSSPSFIPHWPTKQFEFSTPPDGPDAPEKNRTSGLTHEALRPYQFTPETYIQQRLDWKPWAGTPERPGQQEILDAYTLALRQLHEKSDWEQGLLAEDELRFWKPGQVIQNYIRVEAGHTVGKTKLSSGLVNHFLDCFVPSIIYTFAPSWKQIHDLLWKEIKTDRRGKDLPGRILDLELKVADNHFANGAATNDANGRGTERVQGQHGRYLLFILDEAEGIPDFVWNAVDSMASGGICIVLLFANPRTRSSRFHKIKARATVRSFRISCIGHPNCIEGREVVPGAVQRQYVETMLEAHCQAVLRHQPDKHTFEVPWRPGQIFLPNGEFCFRVLGIAPADIAGNTLMTVGRYEAAKSRWEASQTASRWEASQTASRWEASQTASRWEASQTAGGSLDGGDPDDGSAQFGVDVSGFGKDFGTLWVRFRGVAYRAAQFWKQDYDDYARGIKDEALRLHALGCSHISLRIDAGGGFGQGVLSHLKKDQDVRDTFPGARWVIHEVNFGTPPQDAKAFANTITELYAQAAETLKGVALKNPPPELEEDLCERTYAWVNASGISVKRLEDKDDFRKRHEGRSPDDGDGFVLAVAGEFLFKRSAPTKTQPVRPQVFGISRR